MPAMVETDFQVPLVETASTAKAAQIASEDRKRSGSILCHYFTA
jgi:hypothetical protein